MGNWKWLAIQLIWVLTLAACARPGSELESLDPGNSEHSSSDPETPPSPLPDEGGGTEPTDPGGAPTLPADFVCKPAAGGQVCVIPKVKTAKFSYSQPIAVLIPSRMIGSQRMILHLHGHRTGLARDKDMNAMLDDFQLLPTLNAFGRTDTLIVFPMSLGNCTTFEKELAPKMNEFIDWISAQLPQKPQRWWLSAHSGAYRSVASILSLIARSGPNSSPLLSGVALFDATYGGSNFNVKPYTDMRVVNPQLSILSIYRGFAGSETIQGSVRLKSSLGLSAADVAPNNTQKFPGSNDHWDLVQAYYPYFLSRQL